MTLRQRYLQRGAAPAPHALQEPVHRLMLTVPSRSTAAELADRSRPDPAAHRPVLRRAGTDRPRDVAAACSGSMVIPCRGKLSS